MKTGRPAKYPRTPFGERIHAAREAMGLSQAQVAEALGITQTAYAVWERHPVALRPDQIQQLTELLHVSVETLYGNGREKRTGGGPVGKARQVFEAVSRLPRRQQQKIVEVVQALVAQQAQVRHA
jgi:transcriptional regulator with XRE-family HTH domain